MNKKLITIGLIILAATITLRIILNVARNIKPDDFKPAGIVFVVDASASNQGMIQEQKQFIKRLCAQLDPDDLIKILRVSETAYLIYEGSPQNGGAVNKALNAFTNLDIKEKGTAYGPSFKKAFTHVLDLKKDGYTPAIIVIGDLEDDGAIENRINWETLPNNVSRVMQYVPDLSLAFLYAKPEKLDKVEDTLLPILGDNHLIVAPEQNADKSVRKILLAIGR